MHHTFQALGIQRAGKGSLVVLEGKLQLCWMARLGIDFRSSM